MVKQGILTINYKDYRSIRTEIYSFKLIAAKEKQRGNPPNLDVVELI
jgi:hypothetical protein